MGSIAVLGLLMEHCIVGFCVQKSKTPQKTPPKMGGVPVCLAEGWGLLPVLDFVLGIDHVIVTVRCFCGIAFRLRFSRLGRFVSGFSEFHGF